MFADTSLLSINYNKSVVTNFYIHPTEYVCFLCDQTNLKEKVLSPVPLCSDIVMNIDMCK